MNTPSDRRPRVHVVARRLWPQAGGDTAHATRRHISELTEAGFHVSVSTPRYKGGGESMTVADVMVHRPIARPRNDWAARRYVKIWSRWLVDQAAGCDVLLAIGAREEAAAMVSAARHLGLPSVVRVIGGGAECDLAAWNRWTKLRRCVTLLRNADALLVNDRVIHKELLLRGFADDSCIRLPLIGHHAIDHDPALRKATRQALATANSDLRTDADTPVALCCAAMVRGGRIDSLAAAWMPVHAAHPAARLWILGDGTGRDRLHNRLRADGTRVSVAVPGTFVDIRDVLPAADVFIHLEDSPAVGHLAEAIHFPVRLVVLDTSRNREFLEVHPANPIDASRVVYCGATPPSIKRAIRESFQAGKWGLPDTPKSRGSQARPPVSPEQSRAVSLPDVLRRMIGTFAPRTTSPKSSGPSPNHVTHDRVPS
ncbi:MAG: glycosyltransferase [Planctomycetota bacterium]